MINKKVKIDFDMIISQLKIGDHIPNSDNYDEVWVIDELYNNKDEYCKCHLKYIGDYESEEGDNGEEILIDLTDNIDYYDEIKIFSYNNIIKAFKDLDDSTFDLETAFKEVLNIE